MNKFGKNNEKILLIISILLLQNVLTSSVLFAQSYGSMYAVNPASQTGISGWTTVAGFNVGDKSTDITFAANIDKIIFFSFRTIFCQFYHKFFWKCNKQLDIWDFSEWKYP